MDTRQHDDISLGTRGLARERQAVADDVGDRVENVRGLIVVRQDDSVALLFEFQDRSDVIGEDRPWLSSRTLIKSVCAQIGVYAWVSRVKI